MQRLRFKADDGSSFPDWKEKKLEDVCEYRKGQSVGVNYVGTENMNQNFSGVDSLDSTNEVKGVTYCVGDTLMSNIRPYLKKTWKADRNGVCSTDVLVFRPVNIDSDFLYCNIASEKFVSYVMTGVKGSKMPRGDKKHIMEYDIPVPSIPEQQKIAEFLSTIDTVIEKQKKTVSAWEERKKGVMQKLFSQEVRFKADDGSDFPEWEEKKFCEVIKLYRGSSPRPIVEYIVDDSQGLNWIKIRDVPQNGNVIVTVKEHISKEGAKKSRAVYKGEIILSNSMSFGKPCILGIDGFIHDGWFVVREYEKYLNKWYLCQLLDSNIMYKQYRRLAAGGVVLNISSEIVNSTKIPVPSLPEQQKIADCLSSLDEVIEKQKAILAAWEELKKGLLQQMFV